MGLISAFLRCAIGRLPAGLLPAWIALCVALTLRANAATQQFTLQPGWNAIYLEVAPTNPDPLAVFAGLPVDQVWAFFPTRSPVEYVSDPAAGLFNIPGWNVWLPPGSRADAEALSDLRGVISHQAYLLKNTGTAPAILTVSGSSSVRDIQWNPDSFTLTGLSVQPDTTVRSGDFFSNSPAHKGQLRYRLAPNGTWTALTDSSALTAGQAYWIYSKGGSDFSAPLAISFGGGRLLEFGTDQTSRLVTVRNRSAYPTNVTITNSDGFPFIYQELNAATGQNEWLPLDILNRLIPPGASTTLNLGIRRADLPADRETLLQISGGGVALQLPVSAQVLKEANTAAARFAPLARSGRISASAIGPAPTASTGLWVGTATLSAVSEANSSDTSAVTPTPAEFSFRLLVHVDTGGTARLLKEVILMKKHVEGAPDAANPPPFVLVTDPSKLGDYDAPLKRDGSPYAYRTSSVGIDFAGTEVLLSGSFGSSLAGKIEIGRTLPTNPFKHRYHPDHDDLDAQFLPFPGNIPAEAQEVWSVTRDLELTFDTPTTSNNTPSSGYSERTGSYRETVTGLHKNVIITKGTFRLSRLNTLGEINPTQ
ncbi:MAG: hypothetical protein JWL90_1123 [Chthoniobacteraceae bacterium]|nr:hypothetical protein [Chthoniobacteraceae bacterium]